MSKCPYCQAKTCQNKAGLTPCCSQRFRCMHCQRKYTPEPMQHGYPESVRQQAIKLYVDGLNLRRIARHLKIHHRTVSLWVKEHVAGLPPAQVPKDVHTAQLDELFNFIGEKKTKSTS